MSRLDQMYRSLILSKFFIKGWGNPENLKRLLEFRKIISCRETCQHLVAEDYPVQIDKEHEERDCIIQEGHFMSPFNEHLPGIMPSEVQTARFQIVLPKQWAKNLPQHWPSDLRPVCLHLAGTGDHYFKRRRTLMAKPLLKEAGIASIILENPYYGYRKPKEQTRSSLHNVSDLFVMGGALVLESMALFHWCKRQGYGPLGITGISMGGHMASLAASNWKTPLSLIPCMSWTTASSVFINGVLSGSIPWKLLQEQFERDVLYGQEISKLVFSPEMHTPNPFYSLGQDFVKSYPDTLYEMKNLQDLRKLGDLSKLSSAEILELKQLLHMDDTPPEEISAKYNLDELLQNTQDLSCKAKKSNKKVQDMNNVAKDSIKQVQDINKVQNMGFHTSVQSNAADNASEAQADTPNKSGVRGLKRLVHLLSKIQWKPRQKSGTKKDAVNIQKDTLEFMQGIMDECTHLGNFSIPLDTELIILVLAKKDAYVPTHSVISLQDLWPGAEVRYINTGHIGAFVFKQDEFRKAIIESFDRQIEKYFKAT